MPGRKPPREARKGVCHKTRFHAFSAWQLPTIQTSVSPSQVPDTPVPLSPSPAPILNLQLRPRLFFIIPPSQLPSAILHQLLRQHEQGAQLSFLLIQHPAWGLSPQKDSMNEVHVAPPLFPPT